MEFRISLLYFPVMVLVIKMEVPVRRSRQEKEINWIL